MEVILGSCKAHSKHQVPILLVHCSYLGGKKKMICAATTGNQPYCSEVLPGH
jgi:hypothetical protein